jgi:hypothetical protein
MMPGCCRAFSFILIGMSDQPTDPIPLEEAVRRIAAAVGLPHYKIDKVGVLYWSSEGSIQTGYIGMTMPEFVDQDYIDFTIAQIRRARGY